jgi:hypothetical protein
VRRRCAAREARRAARRARPRPSRVQDEHGVAAFATACSTAASSAATASGPPGSSDHGAPTWARSANCGSTWKTSTAGHANGSTATPRRDPARCRPGAVPHAARGEQLRSARCDQPAGRRKPDTSANSRSASPRSGSRPRQPASARPSPHGTTRGS